MHGWDKIKTSKQYVLSNLLSIFFIIAKQAEDNLQALKWLRLLELAKISITILLYHPDYFKGEEPKIFRREHGHSLNLYRNTW